MDVHTLKEDTRVPSACHQKFRREDWCAVLPERRHSVWEGRQIVDLCLVIKRIRRVPSGPASEGGVRVSDAATQHRPATLSGTRQSPLLFRLPPPPRARRGSQLCGAWTPWNRACERPPLPSRGPRWDAPSLLSGGFSTPWPRLPHTNCATFVHKENEWLLCLLTGESQGLAEIKLDYSLQSRLTRVFRFPRHIHPSARPHGSFSVAGRAL